LDSAESACGPSEALKKETDMTKTFFSQSRGAAGIETAIAVPIVVLIGVAVLEFGHAYQTWQVLTNAAREGAKVAVVAGTTDAQVESAVRTYMQAEHLPNAATTPVVLDRHVTVGGTTGSQITIEYPFEFMMLNPAVQLVRPDFTTSAPLTMSAVAIMRNES
jgi:Flp pilus assembly protein TadG